MERQQARNRQRSAPVPSGISAASEAGEPSSGSPRKKSSSVAIQFYSLPATVNRCAGHPMNPCQANPQMTYTRAATAMTHSEASIE